MKKRNFPLKKSLQRLTNSNPYLHAATSKNTRKAYRSDIEQFISWGGLLPASPEMVISYLQENASQLNARTLMRRLTSIKHWHLYQGFLDPTSSATVRKTLTGIMNIHGKPKRKASALSLEHLIKIVQFITQKNTLIMWRNNAILQLGFFGALRVNELVGIKMEHISFVSEGMEILIPRSKTDPNGQGQYCAIPYGNNLLCAVTALKIWCEKAAIYNGFIFRQVDKHQNIGIKSLTHKSVSLVVKALAKACELPFPENYSSHSLRRGFATTASRKGVPIVSIMHHGRWRHEGTVLGYIEEGQRFEANAVREIFNRS